MRIRSLKNILTTNKHKFYTNQQECPSKKICVNLCAIPEDPCRNRSFLGIIIVIFTTSVLVHGCASVQEPFRVIWGSSTAALRQARHAEEREFSCSYDDCFDKTIKILKQTRLTIFINNKQKGEIVVMNAKNSIDTTEVGIFFTPLETASSKRKSLTGFSKVQDNKVKVQIKSLSPRAANAVSVELFSKLEEEISVH